jgi:amidohydrolase
MIEEGVLEDPKPIAILGQHVMPLIDAGNVGFRPGRYMASADEITLIVKGKGGHAALPHMANDVILGLSHIIVALQQVVSRKANPLVPTVLSFSTLQAGEGAFNVLPVTAMTKGTLRTMDESWRYEAHDWIHQIAENTARAAGLECEVKILKGYPVLDNAVELTRRTTDFASKYLGEEKVEELGLWMAAEDFAYYSQQCDACFYRLGTRNEEKGITSAVHTPTFDIDEDALALGPGLMAYLAYSNLKAATKHI